MLLAKETWNHMGNTMEKSKRITWLDAAKGYGILLVIFAHVDYYSFLRGFIYTFHMPLCI